MKSYNTSLVAVSPDAPRDPKTSPSNILTVLHVIPSLEIGGMEQVVAQLVQTLDPNRFRPVVACIESLGPIGQELQRKGMRVVLLPPMTPVVSFLYPTPLVRLIREIRPDVLHVHSGCWYKSAVAGRLCGVKNIVYTMHGRATQSGLSIRILDSICSRLTSHIVAVSRELADFVEKKKYVREGELSVIVNGIECDRFTPAREKREGPVVVGIIARLAPVKDVATLLRAMQILVQDSPDAVLFVVGDGPERTSLERLSCELGLTENINFLGFRQDVPEILREIDIFALSSLSEGTSISVLEAMAAGIPVVATRVGGNPALIKDGENGFLVPPGNPAELAKALLRLVRDESLRKVMGETNRQKAEREFGIEAMTRHYEFLYAD